MQGNKMREGGSVPRRPREGGVSPQDLRESLDFQFQLPPALHAITKSVIILMLNKSIVNTGLRELLCISWWRNTRLRRLT